MAAGAGGCIEPYISTNPSILSLSKDCLLLEVVLGGTKNKDSPSTGSGRAGRGERLIHKFRTLLLHTSKYGNALLAQV